MDATLGQLLTELVQSKQYVMALEKEVERLQKLEKKWKKKEEKDEEGESEDDE